MPASTAHALPDAAAAAERDLAAYVAADRAKSLLRFVTCGSVDDGKSTLIGRLLYDSKRLFQDQLATLEADSRRFGTQGQALDFALLVDGLSAEREQGITIDVAYRYFATDARKFIVADAPGHEQYTRNMATAASTADLAVILIDARRGVLAQTRRHSHIVALLGVRSVVLAVNKMDLVGHDRAAFDAIVADYAAFAAGIGITDFTAIPMSALTGDNVTRAGLAMRWYAGPTLVEALAAAPAGGGGQAAGFAMPVQRVVRPDAGFRGFAGTIAAGRIAPGDPVVVAPGGAATTVARIVTFDGDLAEAWAGQAVTLVLADEVECAAGATLAAPGAVLAGDALAADLVWFDDAPLDPGRRYLMQLGAAQVPVRVALDRIVPIAGAAAPGPVLAMNGIAAVRLRAEAPVAALPYADNRALGAFVLIDPASHATAAAGMLRAIGGDGDAAAGAAGARLYTVRDAAQGARALARLHADGAPASLLDAAILRAGVAADLPADADAALWQRALAVAALLNAAGVTVVLDLPPGDAVPAAAVAWHDAPAADWVI